MNTKRFLRAATITASLVVAVSGMSAIVPLAAGAAEAPTGDVRTWVDHNDILWIEASVAAGDADVVKINVRTPAQDGTRELWQRCRFEFSSAGTYRCGIDVGDGSLARRRLGNWVAGVALDGNPLDRAYFSTSR
jgi:hypothetical protein